MTPQVDHLRTLLRHFLDEAAAGSRAHPPSRLWLCIEPRFEELTPDEQQAALDAATRWRLQRRKAAAGRQGEGPS